MLTTVEDRIGLQPDTRLVFQDTCRGGLKTREREDQETDWMFKESLREPAMSHWTSSVVLASKKDVKLRFYVDYRELDAMTVRNAYNLPRVDEYIDSSGDATIFLYS